MMEKVVDYPIPEGMTLGMITHKTIGIRKNKQLYERENKGRDAYFGETTTWHGNQPWEGHSLWDQKEKWFHYPSEIYGYHLHHLPRTSNDAARIQIPSRIATKDLFMPTEDHGDITLEQIFGEFNPNIPLPSINEYKPPVERE
jgi:hypothetical protein